MAATKTFFVKPLALLLTIIALIVGILIGINLDGFLPKSDPEQTITKSNKDTNELIFSSQFATINGKVLKVNEKTITIQKEEHIAEFKLNKPFFIFRPATLSKPSPPSEDIKIVPLNEFATLNLQKVNGEYLVNNINLLPPSGNSLPIPSNFPLTSPPSR